MKWLLAVLSAVLQAVMPWVAGRRPAARDADPDRDTRDRLEESVRRHWKDS